MNHNSFPATQSENFTAEENDQAKEEFDHLPTTSPDINCRFYLKEITDRLNTMSDIKDFLQSTTDRDFHEFKDQLDLDAFCDTYSEFVDPILTPQDKAALKNYSGFNYKLINQVARGIWDYDLLGTKTPEKVDEARASIAAINQAISHVPAIDADLTAHRGTNLDSFRNYGIQSLADLSQLEGQFFLETGFTSTSLSPDESYVGKDFDDPLRRSCNIAITCRIPKESRDGVGLFYNAVSYSPSQCEFLLRQDSLFYISSATVSPDGASGHLEMTLIPQNIYDPAPPSEGTDAYQG